MMNLNTVFLLKCNIPCYCAFVYIPTVSIYSDSKEEKGDGRPAWMKTLNTTSTEWLSLLPAVRLICLC